MKRFIPVTLLILSACFDTPSEPPPPPPEPEPVEEPAAEQSAGEKAGAIAKELQASPEKAEEILSTHGMSRSEFETLLMEVAVDAEQSKVYAAALEG